MIKCFKKYGFPASVVCMGLLGVFLYPYTHQTHSKLGLEKTVPNGFRNSKGYVLEQFSFEVDQPRGIIFFAHGAWEHIERDGYLKTFKKMNENGYSCYAINHQGHGNSYGDHMYFEQFSDVINDFIEFIEYKKTTVTDTVPHFVWGHSMGAAITMGVLLNKPELVNGAMINGLPYPVDIPKPVQVLAGFLPKFPFTHLEVSPGLSRNPEAIDRYVADPKIDAVLLGGWLSFLVDWINHYHANFAQVTTPILITHGSGDTVCALQSSKDAFAQMTNCDDKTLKIHDGIAHEPWEDAEFDVFFNDVLTWLNDRTETAV